jgi:hypothetical protein
MIATRVLKIPGKICPLIYVGLPFAGGEMHGDQADLSQANLAQAY